jgi:hypothetical protein
MCVVTWLEYGLTWLAQAAPRLVPLHSHWLSPLSFSKAWASAGAALWLPSIKTGGVEADVLPGPVGPCSCPRPGACFLPCLAEPQVRSPPQAGASQPPPAPALQEAQPQHESPGVALFP